MDKRYESMYQRGHQPGQTADAVPRTAPEVTRPSDPAPPPVEVAPVEVVPVEVAPVTQAGEPVDHESSAPPVAQKANPYVRLLISVGCILTGGAVVALFAGGQLINMQMSPDSFGAQQEAFLLMTYGQSLTTLAPFLLALGLGTLIGIAFLKAHAWQKSQRP